MAKGSDSIIIGAGVVGLSIAFHLARQGVSVTVLEKKYPGSGSTGRCIGGVREQFSSESSILLMKESMAQFRAMEEEFGFAVDFKQGGYLFLAHSQDKMVSFRNVADIQKRMGLDVRILDAEQCLDIVPQLNGEGLVGGVYSPNDGQAYPFKVVEGYIKRIKELGGDIRFFATVSGLECENSRIRGVKLASGDLLHSDVVVNAAGPWAQHVSQMAGFDVPVFPEEHEAFITDRLPPMFDTMVVDYRPDGCYFNQRVNGQVIGCYTPIPNKPGPQTQASMEFLVEMSKRTIRLVPELEKARVIRHWGGSYSMTPDGSPIVDRSPIEGFYLAIGMSGHGFMFAPAVGKFMCDIITKRPLPFNWDEFKLDRDFSGRELMK